ncbi:putative disease resistance protein At1g50180 isoform X1 [Magnolia sinica]|uniref:putative disease resistance protein At1g50180 isoform X1 n=1 Tax=Magnolia sinica TaxID=86752 RepID=UPI00265B1934|nr:putative disease resistance protein At1g50180 isoform X1 [Magnolia sinica]XP_058114866.1 putative disease resistance protein At1g50180 isoform X1 [Magnolia sinica]XP_058114867.1 putative disease resistance protein At1g50180 isoform X1 [Magnolia sinica]XP_058114868.1 putative disease resistance protein At1g50180 isoform X1 [Magnolia sinica]XP_058114869.1 putative disease resistance protein At1g50180 isoform X1 [Magnolia sinica]XP_058114870.1 putative disease resistance protein At1g50180 isof
MIAEAVVSSVIEKLGDLLIHEGFFLREVCGEVEWVQKELTWMQAFLKDAETKQNDARVKKWVEDVRDIAYKAEDIIDEFIFKIEQKRRGFLGPIKKTFARHQLGKEIEKIKNQLDEISKRRSNYGIKDLCQGGEGSSSMSESLREQRRTSHLYEQTELIGFQEDIRTLVARLSEGDRRRCVISIVGMGGLGKTTLAKKVYNHDAVKKHFNCCAWIYVSQEYNVKDLLLSIMRCFMIPTEDPNVDQLRVKLFEHLMVRRYFVVVDDIWKTEAWDALAATFPDTNNGSRILLTTRNKDIATDADARCRPHELQLLREDESWELFNKKVFFQEDSHCPQYLEGLGRQIVAKCHGLPLAVVVISGLLSRKPGLLSEWEKVLKSISWQFVEGDANISPILALSYEDLPYHLKSCFLYLVAFPENYEISVEELIWFWVAEGFVHARGAETLEEVAEDCVQELIQRSLIQVVKKSFIGTIKSCRIHDLLRDLSISKAKEENFLHRDTDPLFM